MQATGKRSQRLRLRAVSFTRVEFALIDQQGTELRPVVVRVGSGSSWRHAVEFPSCASHGTEPTGDERLDREVCERAAEELARLDAAVQTRDGRAG